MAFVGALRPLSSFFTIPANLKLFWRDQQYWYLEVGALYLLLLCGGESAGSLRVTHDRLALILRIRVCPLRIMLETIGYFWTNNLFAPARSHSSVPMGGWLGRRTMLGSCWTAALAVEKFIPTARQPDAETAGALLVVAAAAYTTEPLMAGPAGTRRTGRRIPFF